MGLLAWIAGGLVFLAVLAFAVAASANGVLRARLQEPALATVVLPPLADRVTADAAVARLVDSLRVQDGIAFVRPVTEAELGKLIEPWLDLSGVDGSRLMPRLIDIGFNPGRAAALRGIEAVVGELVPGASLQLAQPDQGVAALAFLRAAALLVGAAFLLGIAAPVTVVTALSIRQQARTVDLLRLVGAAEGYVARQFEQLALRRGLRGALMGFTAAAMAVLGFAGAGRLMPGAALPPVVLGPADWALLACVPVLAALIAAPVARLTAQRRLARMHPVPV